jgi:hypothetical protein
VEAETSSFISVELVDAAPRKNKVGRPKGSLNKATEFKLSAGAMSSENRIVGVQSALTILESDSLCKLSEDDLHVLEQMRVWGPTYDLVSGVMTRSL